MTYLLRYKKLILFQMQIINAYRTMLMILLMVAYGDYFF